VDIISPTCYMKRTGFKIKPRKPLKRGKLAKKRKKKSPREILRDKAWTTFSKWIRNRDGKCITCATGKAENAGHYWHGKLDFDEININGQCVRCNKWNSGNLASYTQYLLEKYGIEEFNKLTDRKNKAVAEYRTEEDYQEIIKKYER